VERHHSDPEAPPHTVTGAQGTSPTHAARPRPHTIRLVAAVCGSAAALAAITVGISALLHSPGSMPSRTTSANMITVGPRVPLSDPELIALVGRIPNFGSLTDPKRRSACLRALGYSGTAQVLGATSVQIGSKTAVVLVLPGQKPDELAAFAVASSCSSVDTGLIADTTVRRP